MRRGNRLLNLGLVAASALTLGIVLATFVDQRLSRACPGNDVLRQDEVVYRALSWVLEFRGGELRYSDTSDVLQHNPNCCALIDPTQSNATDAAFGMPSRTSLIFQLLVPHYTIVVVTIAAAPTDTVRHFEGAVAVDRCGDVLGWSNGAISGP